MSKCKVHHWRTPEIGDEHLICEVCGRRLHFMNDITLDIRASIVNGYERRMRNEAQDQCEKFKDAFNKAFDYLSPIRPPDKVDQPTSLPKKRKIVGNN